MPHWYGTQFESKLLAIIGLERQFQEFVSIVERTPIFLLKRPISLDLLPEVCRVVEWQNSRSAIKKLFNLTFNLRKSIHFVWESSPKLVLANVSLLFIQGVLPVFLLYTMKLLVDAITTAVAANPDERSFQPVLQVLILAASLALVNAVINRIGEFVTRIQGWSVVDHMNNVLQAKGIEADLEYYENPQYQDTLHRAQREATYRPIMILNSLAQIIQSSISLIGIGWLLFSYNWVVAPVLIMAVVPGIIARMFYSNRQYWLERKVTPQERESWYYHWIIISTDFAKEVRIFGLGATVRQRYQRLRSDIRRARTKLEFQNTFFAVFAQIISTSVVYALYGLIAYQTLKGRSTLGDFVMYFQAFQRGQNYLQNIFGSLARLYENNLFLSNLYEFLDLKQKVSEPLTPVSIPDPIQTGIVFDKVTFNYPNNSKTILKDINLCIRPGEVIALGWRKRFWKNNTRQTTYAVYMIRLMALSELMAQFKGFRIKRLA